MNARELSPGDWVRSTETGARGIVEDDPYTTFASGHLRVRWVDDVWVPELRDYLASSTWDLLWMHPREDVPLERCAPVLRARTIH